MSFGMVAASYAATISVPAPVLAVGFSEGTGSTFAPTIGPGTGIVEPTYGQWTTGIHGTALGRNGTAGPTGNPTRITGLSSLQTSSWTGLTVMAWVKVHDMAEGVRYPLFLSQGTTETMMAWRVSINSARPQSYVKDAYSANAADSAFDDTWVHLCTTWDGTQQLFYVNGLDPVVTPVTGPLQDIDTIYIGSIWDGNVGAYGVDDLRVYDTALSLAQITTLMGTAV